MKRWSVLFTLAAAQFVMILDSTVMNVSISTVARDLHTTISGMQTAITFYALTMAAFMLLGGKLGDAWGRLTAFRIGSVVYGAGSLITALSPTLLVLLFGWSIVEGIGAVLVIPAIASLTAASYSGPSRIKAFAIIGAAAGIAAAAGPLIGGFVTTYLSWRYVFAAETIIMLGVLWRAQRIIDAPVDHKASIDIPSAILAALGMSALVYGALQSKTWGWVRPVASPVSPLGISLVTYLLLAGIVILWIFIRRQRSLEAASREPLLKVSLLSIAALRSGLATLLSEYFTIAALFFIIPVYLQTILGSTPLETGIKLVPLSIGLVLCAAVGSRVSTVRSARRITRWGQLAMAAGALLLLAAVQPQLSGSLFWIAMFIVGAGFGLMTSQLGNTIMSAVSAKETAEAGGLQGTFQNLGTSFGTAVVGSVFMLALTSGFTSAVQGSPGLTPAAKSAIAAQAASGIQVVSQEQARSYVVSQGGSAVTADTVSRLYTQSQLQALRLGILIIFLFAVGSILVSRGLPNTVREAPDS